MPGAPEHLTPTMQVYTTEVVEDGLVIQYQISKIPGYDAMIEGKVPVTKDEAKELESNYDEWDNVKAFRLSNGKIMVCLTEYYQTGKLVIHRIDGRIVYEETPVSNP